MKKVKPTYKQLVKILREQKQIMNLMGSFIIQYQRENLVLKDKISLLQQQNKNTRKSSK